MGLEFTRGNSARCPPFLVGGLMIMCLFLLCSWWSLSSQNFELLRQNDNLAAQLRINGEELKDRQKQMAQLEVQINEIKESNQEFELQCRKQKDACETEMESLKKLGEAKEKNLETLRTNKNSLENDLKEEKKKVSDLENELKEKNDRLSALQKEIEEKKLKIEELKLIVPASNNLNALTKKPIVYVMSEKLKKDVNPAPVARVETPVMSRPESMDAAGRDENNGGEAKVDDAAAEDEDPREREMEENTNNGETS